MILLEYENIKPFLQKAMFQIGLKKFMWLKKLKALYHECMLLVIWKAKKLLEHSLKKNCKKQIIKNKECRVERVIKRKGNKLCLIERLQQFF